ncbi:MAG TPA: Ig-like domain-containing protein, partial [Casimicrobium sp.]|nr:Ig-like domain-containing protein [Casimicrobium sp.]
MTFRINYASGGPFVRLTVTAAPTLTPTVQLQSANGSIATGQSVALSATVNGSSGAATGTVLFRDTSGNVISGCAAKPLVAGVATCNTTFSTVGTYTLLADYSGDVNYRAETSSTITQNVVAPTVPSEPGWTTFGVSAPEGIG